MISVYLIQLRDYTYQLGKQQGIPEANAFAFSAVQENLQGHSSSDKMLKTRAAMHYSGAAPPSCLLTS